MINQFTVSSYITFFLLAGWTGSNCTAFNYCWNQTCLNGGTCTSLSTKYSCKCNVNFTGISSITTISINFGPQLEKNCVWSENHNADQPRAS